MEGLKSSFTKMPYFFKIPTSILHQGKAIWGPVFPQSAHGQSHLGRPTWPSWRLPKRVGKRGEKVER